MSISSVNIQSNQIVQILGYYKYVFLEESHLFDTICNDTHGDY